MNKSLWLDFPKIKTYPTLEHDLEVDVCVIGGGITGITSALYLVEEGFKVAIVEANHLFHGTTGHTTAKLTIQHGLVYDKLINKRGFEMAELYAESNSRAIEQVKRNIKAYQIDCDYIELPNYVYTQDDSKISKIEQEFKATEKLKLNSFLVDDLKLPFKVKKAIGFKNQAQFHVTKYLHKLVEEFARNDDSYIFENTKVIDVKEEDSYCHVFTENGKKVKAQHVIVASHYPCHNLYNLYFAKLEPYTSYLIACDHEVPLEPGMYINVEKPTRSLRTQVYNGKELLLIAGENHKTGHFHNIESHYETLFNFGKEHFKAKEKLFQWMTEDFDTFDYVPYIGRVNSTARNVYVATGFKKWGMTTSNVAAMLLRDMITNKKSEYEALYNPMRITDKLSCRFYSYNLSSVGKLVLDRVTPSPTQLTLNKGEGKIFSHKGKKYGGYKDENGQTYIVDATCPHLKCILKFNQDEKTYDCPCHGSRFTYTGKYIDGPSIKDLNRINFKNIK